MSTSLSSIAVEKRRQVAATLGLFAMVFLAVGAVSATSASTSIVKAFVVVALLVALLLALMAWGVLHSVKRDIAERELDATITAALAARGRSMCDCGVEHDPTELRLVGDEHGKSVADQYANSGDCAHDGLGTDCSHSCDMCILSAMRPSPHRTRAERLATPRE